MNRSVPSGSIRARILTWVVSLLLAATASLHATTVRPFNLETLAHEADSVVRAHTVSVTAEKRAAAGGRKIVTRVEFEVLEPVAGRPPARLTLEFLGGRVGEEAMSVQGMPVFVAGQEEILFVQDGARSVCPLVGMMYGRYAVQRDPVSGRRYVARNDGLPVRSLSDVPAPHGEIALDDTSRAAAIRTALTPEEFVQLIKAARARSSRER